MTISAQVSLDFEQWIRKPSDKLQYKNSVDKFGTPKTEARVIGARLGSNIEEVTPTSLARKIQRGHTWSPFVFNVCPNWQRPRRIQDLFKSCQVFAIDFDNGETPEEIMNRASELGVEFNIVHHSFSSTPEFNKLRGILFVEKEITSFDEARRYSTALAYAFDGDKQCIDVARLYYGSKEGSVIHVSNSSLTSLESLDKIVDAVNIDSLLVKSEKNIAKTETAEWGDAKEQRKILSTLTPAKRSYVKRKALGILKDIESFDGSKGSRYECIWRNTSRLARMPELVGSAVYQWVMESIGKNSHFDDWDKNASNVVMSAIEWSNDHADEPV
jgi:hypothetical protein